MTENKTNINYKITENIKLNGNKEDIKRVISTIVENAIMHTKEDENIYIELEKEKNNAIIQINK